MSKHLTRNTVNYIADGVTSLEVSHYLVKPYIIEHYIKRLKHNKDYGNIRFNSNHLLYGGKRLHVLFSLFLMLCKSMVIPLWIYYSHLLYQFPKI